LCYINCITFSRLCDGTIAECYWVELFAVCLMLSNEVDIHVCEWL